MSTFSDISSNSPYFRPEEKLVLCAARRHMEGAVRQRFRRLLLQPGLDWSYLVDTARRHGIAPLLHEHMKKHGPEPFPRAGGPASMKLERHFQQNLRRNLFLMDRLDELAGRFTEAGITFVPYKGPVLARAAYGNIAFREFQDIDVMVRMSDVARSVKILTEAGYSAQNERALGPAHEDFDLGQYGFADAARYFQLELHWRFTPGNHAGRLHPEDMAGRLRPVRLGRNEAATFAPEDTMLIICGHAAKHAWERLEWVAATAELAARGSLDWEVVLGRAHDCGLRRSLISGLILARDLLDARLPEDLQREMEKDRASMKLALAAGSRLFDQQQRNAAELAIFHTRSTDSGMDAARYCLARLTTGGRTRPGGTGEPSRQDESCFARPLRIIMTYGPGFLWRSAGRKTHGRRRASF